jgi:hypothetical protein
LPFAPARCLFLPPEADPTGTRFPPECLPWLESTVFLPFR